MRLAAVLALALAFVPAARAGTTTTATIPTPQIPATQTAPRTTQQQAIQLFLGYGKVARWLKRYPPRPVTDATFAQGVWTVNVWSGKAGEIATGTVDDASGAITAAWTGPQVAWKMARGYKGAFGGATINGTWLWLSFCALFLLGLADWRRPLSVRNVDLVVLLSFSISLWYFNHGNIFTAVPLFYPLRCCSRIRRSRGCSFVACGSRAPITRRAGRRCGRCGCSPRRRCSSPAFASA